MALRVNVVCRNYKADRILARMARTLCDQLGWNLLAAPSYDCDLLYLFAYFEADKVVKAWPGIPVMAYFTHREEEPPGNSKAKLWDAAAKRADLRVAMCRMYAESLSAYGLTIQPPLPVERDRFVIAKAPAGKRPIVGLSGYTYSNKRKGQDLAIGMLQSKIGQWVEWRASGRGWPVTTKRYKWAEMPAFYQSLDILVCPSRVEGGPMPVLEALACGVRVVVPKGVGIIDELPNVRGIYRYKRGDLKALIAALERAVEDAGVNRERLRAAVKSHSVEGFIQAHQEGIEQLLNPEIDAGIAAQPETEAVALAVAEIKEVKPVNHGTEKSRGIYCVAFGDPARKSALTLMNSIKVHMPDIPICLCAAKKIGPEDILVIQPDSDIGGRRAKLRAYELTPAEWTAGLYLDADTEVIAPIYQFFEWIEAGWEFVICKDPHLMDTMHSFERRNNRKELEEVKRTVKTLHTLQYNGGVWAFGRNERVAAFFRRWQTEYEKHLQRDQGALIRAMYADPLKVLVLGNEWNTFPKYTKGIKTAGLMHYPGRARRWDGLIPGRIDTELAWAAVKRHEAKHGGRR
ncbi:MAG TPA: glycosyltransferase [Anaerolineae bacterium]|nr:glycosyltransferase [Anaerolineae bacterium]